MPASRRAVILLLILSAAHFAPAIARADDRRTRRATPVYSGRPIGFEANRGQTDPRVRFLARAKGYTLFLTPEGAVFSLADSDRGAATMRMTLVGARTPHRIEGMEAVSGKTHYLRGRNSRAWTTDVPSFAKVRYQDVYRGIDLVYYGNPEQLEYDFVVAAGASPGSIRVRFTGADRLRITESGDLLMRVNQREWRQQRPVAYQIVNGERRSVAVRYTLAADVVRFQVGEYEPALPLVIDPVLLYSSYLGGSGEVWGASELAVDPAGAIYVAGTTTSADFPTTPGALRGEFGGRDYDAFITKFDPDGRVIYSTYFGGHSSNDIGAMAVDGFGAVYVAGVTSAVDFPTTAGAFQTSCARSPVGSPEALCNSGFVSKLSPSGSTFLFSTYFAANVAETSELPAYATEILLDDDLSVILAGNTGRQLPVTAGVLQPVHRGVSWTGFVAKLNSAGSAVLYASYLGGDNFDFVNAAARDSAGNLYLTGESRSTDFPTTEGAFQRTCRIIDVPGPRGCAVAFITKVNSTATSIVYSTLLGGTMTTGPAVDGISSEGNDIVVDANGFAYVTGKSFTLDFPTTPGAFKTAATTWDAFVAKVNLDGTGLVYSTLIGGDVVAPAGVMHETGKAIALDADGSAYVAGVSSAIDFPLVDPLQAEFGGYSWDTFLLRLNPSGSAVSFSTFLGGSSDDEPYQLARLGNGDLLLAGQTRSADFPLVNPAQAMFPGEKASFLARIGEPICGTEVTGQVQVFQSAIVPFFWPFHLQIAIVWNSSPSPVDGPLAYVMDDLQNAVFIGTSKTRCFSPEGDPLTPVPLGADNVLGPNQARLMGLWFYQTQPGPIAYTPRLLSGRRNY